MRQEYGQSWLKPRKKPRDLSGLWLFLGIIAFQVGLWILNYLEYHYWGG